ncbi:hypothetical protein G3T14_05100 [Methylobacterium sp. BTF04]|uniref:hypothetical protein n=1 Tax=Methylobacterium sp. BTF04 TaxID=2708300 RepID=UPI0013D823CE|nr:hypothetical protein [Methylobacterium sp. BTF04]NEU11503.1 hypothetical protein [Methylobacterium sp. BTF04]
MKPVIVACSALLGLSVLTGGPAHRALAQTAPVAPQVAPSSAPAAAAPTVPAATRPPASVPVPQAPPSKLRGPPPPKAGERRRPTYASCNRVAHQRNLHGGARRRFLIRCKLGYDRPRAAQPAQPQSAPARQP